MHTARSAAVFFCAARFISFFYALRHRRISCMKVHFACTKEGKEFSVLVDGKRHSLRMRDFANTNQNLADKLKVSARDIPRLRKCCGVGSSSEIIAKMLEAGFVSGKLVGKPDTDIARIFGIGRHKVAEVRKGLGIASVRPSDFRARTVDWDSVHGELRDPGVPHHEIADTLKISSVSVYRRRKKLVEKGEVPESYLAKWGQPGKQARGEL